MTILMRNNSLVAVLLLAISLLALTACGSDSGPSERDTDEVSSSTSGSDGADDTEHGGGTENGIGSELDDGSSLSTIDTSTIADDGGEGSGKSYSLLVAPKTGEEFTYQVSEKNTTESGEIKITQRIVYNFTCRITGVNSDESFTMDFVFNRIQSQNSFPPGVVDSVARTITMDTKSDNNPSGAAELKALVGQNVKVTIGPDGEVREISNVDPIVSALMKNLPDTLGADIKAKYRERARQVVKVAYFMPVVRQLFVSQIPSREVKVGDTWERNDTLPISSGGAPSTARYKFKSVSQKDGQTVATVVNIVEAKVGNRTIDDETMSAKITDATVEGSAAVEVLVGPGFPVQKETTITQQLTLSGKMKVGPGKGKNETIRRRQTNQVVVKLTKHKQAQ
jgi:hypothetical protein